MARKNTKDKYLSMIEDLKEEQLRQAVCLMAGSSREAEKALLDFLEQIGTKGPEYEEALQRRMKAAEFQIQRTWEDAVIVLEAMEEGDYEELTERGFTDYYFEDANIDEQVQEIRSLIQTEPLSQEFRLEMMEQIITDTAGSEFAGDEELDLAWMLCDSAEAKRKYLEVLREKCPYKHERARRILQEIGSEDDYLAYLEERADIPENAMELYRKYLEEGEAEKAKRVLWMSLEKHPHDQLLLNAIFSGAVQEGDGNAVERLAGILTENMRSDCLEMVEKIAGRLEGESGWEKLDTLLPAAFLCTSSDHNMGKWIGLCQKKMTPGAYAGREKELLSHFKKRDPQGFCLFSIREGRPEEALQALLEEADQSIRSANYYRRYLDEGHVISSRLLDLYPEEIEKHYWREVDSYRFDKDHYARCAEILCELRDLAGSKGTLPAWQSRLDSIVSEGKRRRYLLAELRTKGLIK